MNLTQLPILLEHAHTAGISVFLKSKPGTGKTAIARQYAESKGLKLITIMAPLVDILDSKGLPAIKDGEAHFIPMNQWPKEHEAPVVILLDELPQAVPAIQNTLSQLLIDHQVGEIKLPKGSFVIATGNRKEDKAATNNIPSHIVNRVMHVDVETSLESWLTWAESNKIHPSILGFANFRPDMLHTFDPRKTQDPFATHRTWELASNLLHTNPPQEVLMPALSGLVGEGAAFEYLAFQRLYLDLPKPEEILNRVEVFVCPTDPATIYAIIAAVTHIATEDKVDAIVLLADKLPKEFALVLIKGVGIKLPKARKNKNMKEFTLVNKDLILG